MTEHEINLNPLTLWELVKHKDTYGQYKQDIIALLMSKNLYDFEDDILKKYNAESMEQIALSHPDQFINIGKRIKEGENKWVEAWYDTGKDYIITPKISTYGLFLVYWLRNQEVDQIDDFLAFQYTTHFERDILSFSRTVRLAIRRHGKMMQNEQIETVGEWLSTMERPANVEETAKVIKLTGKGKIKRGAEDKLTALTEQQTALFIHFIQNRKIIFKDEYLNKTEAGQLFSYMTGFSPETLRHDLGKCKEIENMTLKNLSELHTTFLQLAKDVEMIMKLKKE